MSSLSVINIEQPLTRFSSDRDLMMSFCGGCAAFGSGFIKRMWGFHLLANGASLAALALAVYAATMVFNYREGAYSIR